jgi:hypothetical protein
MKTWIEHLNDPLVLVGFIVFILAGVISLFIRKAKPSQSQKVSGSNNQASQAGGDIKKD